MLSDLTKQVSSVRTFNRFYTARLGLLRRHHLDGEFSLTEARVLYEIASRSNLTASYLCETLELDRGYISRLLARLGQRGFVCQKVSKTDGREKLLTLTPDGKRKVKKLNSESAKQIQDLLEPLGTADRDKLVQSIVNILTVLQPHKKPTIRVERLEAFNKTASHLLIEYYDAVKVVQRDSAATVHGIIAGTQSGIWIAYLHDQPVGCVVLRKLESIPHAGECKRLYVQPQARGHRIGDALLDALEAHARRCGLQWIYLDSYDALEVAIALYKRRGYTSCDRYNDNPQATVFYRKKIR